MVIQASRWNAADYARNAAFVPALGVPALRLLDPRPGELILDLGCGDGALTVEIEKAGAKAIGLDASPDMVEAARARGVDAFAADAQTLGLPEQRTRFGSFDAVFSNAALHWMLDKHAVAAGVFAVLKAGGRFVGEMGGEGNLRTLRDGLRDELTARGYTLPDEDPQWYAGPDDFAAVYEAAGFVDVQAQLIPRPTPLPTGIAGWVTTLRAGMMEMVGVPKAEQADVAAAVEAKLSPLLTDATGTVQADYVRLRFTMRKPA